MPLPQWLMLACGVRPPPVLHVGPTGSVASSGSTSVSLPNVSANRMVVICLGCGVSGGNYPTAVSLGGVAATLVQNSGGSSSLCAIWTVNLPTGSNPTLAITGGGGQTWAYSLFEIDNGAALTPVGYSGTSGSTTSTATVATGSSRIIICSGTAGAISSPTLSWTGNLTAGTTVTVGTTGRSGAAYATTLTGSQVCTATAGGGGTPKAAMAAVTF